MQISLEELVSIAVFARAMIETHNIDCLAIAQRLTPRDPAVDDLSSPRAAMNTAAQVQTYVNKIKDAMSEFETMWSLPSVVFSSSGMDVLLGKFVYPEGDSLPQYKIKVHNQYDTSTIMLGAQFLEQPRGGEPDPHPMIDVGEYEESLAYPFTYVPRRVGCMRAAVPVKWFMDINGLRSPSETTTRFVSVEWAAGLGKGQESEEGLSAYRDSTIQPNPLFYPNEENRSECIPMVHAAGDVGMISEEGISVGVPHYSMTRSRRTWREFSFDVDQNRRYRECIDEFENLASAEESALEDEENEPSF